MNSQDNSNKIHHSDAIYKQQKNDEKPVVLCTTAKILLAVFIVYIINWLM